MEQHIIFHSLSSEETLAHFSVAKEGLSATEVAERKKKYGPNLISGGHKRTALDILIDQFRNFLLWLLIVAAILSFYIGHGEDAIGITLAIGLSVIFGFALEYKADESMRALKALQSPKAIVTRNGKHEVIDASELVPGDIIHFEEGEKIAADCRIIEAFGFQTNESPLTGESMAVVKTANVIPENAPLSERINMVYAGTFVVQGKATAVVAEIGNGTELGKIAARLSEIESEETLLQKSLDSLGKKVSIVSIAIIAVFFVIGLLQSREISELFVLAISLMVAAVPEGLLTVLTIVLAMGVKKMAEHNALVRKINAVETLGNATVMVIDKTGTVTKGKMELSRIFYRGIGYDTKEMGDGTRLLEFASYCNSAKVTELGFVGDEMDRAILHTAEIRGVEVHKIKKSQPIEFNPLDSHRKMMSGIYEVDGERLAIVKGAPEIVLGLCTEIENAKGITKAGKKEMESAEKELNSMASEGMRVLAVAYKKAKAGMKTETDVEKDLVFLGFMAFSDPPRPESAETLEIARNAGIRVLMLTGDNLKTAMSIGKEVGLIKENNQADEWKNLEKLTEAELAKRLDNLGIIARSTPLSKLKIVEMLLAKGEVVVVTGDGVNDALALKKAQVGVVMGSGTDVSKEAGNLVLLDDNLATLISAIKYGRTIFSNILNFIRFQFTTNVAILTLFFISFFAGLPYILGPIQILFINIVMDGPPALALGFEKAAKGVLLEKPRRGTSILTKSMAISILTSAIFMVAVTLAVFWYYSGKNPVIATTAAFAAFVLLQLFNALNCRSAKEPFYSNLASNKYLIATLIGLGLLLVAIIELPGLEDMFSTKALGAGTWALLVVAGSSVLAFEEIKKFLKFF